LSRFAGLRLEYKFALPLPPRLVGDLLDWREEILEDAAGAEMDLGADLHARARRNTKEDSQAVLY